MSSIMHHFLAVFIIGSAFALFIDVGSDGFIFKLFK